MHRGTLERKFNVAKYKNISFLPFCSSEMEIIIARAAWLPLLARKPPPGHF